MAATSLMIGSMSDDDVRLMREKEENKRPLEPHQKPIPKGMKLYFFNIEGEYSTDHMLKTDVVFECFASNDKNAIKKFNKKKR